MLRVHVDMSGTVHDTIAKTDYRYIEVVVKQVTVVVSFLN